MVLRDQLREGEAMSSLFTCPHCKKVHDSSDYPDHIQSASKQLSGITDFECECGAAFDIEVDWSPHVHVLHSTLKEPAKRKKGA